MQMIDHMKLIKGERFIDVVSECVFELLFELFDFDLNRIFLICGIVLAFVADGIVVADESGRPKLHELTK